MENLTNGSPMDDDANAHHEDEVNGNEEKIGFEEDVTEKMSEKSDMLENVLSREEPKPDTEDNVGNYQGDSQQEEYKRPDISEEVDTSSDEEYSPVEFKRRVDNCAAPIEVAAILAKPPSNVGRIAYEEWEPTPIGCEVRGKSDRLEDVLPREEPKHACEESNPLEVAATIQPLQEVHERVEEVTRVHYTTFEDVPEVFQEFYLLPPSNTVFERAPDVAVATQTTCQVTTVQYEAYPGSGLSKAPSVDSLIKEDVPLIPKDEIKEQMLQNSGIAAFPTSKISPPKKMINSEDHIKLGLILAAEEALLMSDKSADVVDGGVVKMRCRNIATAIYLDDEQNLKRFMTGSRLRKKEIQRRMLETVELNSLKCLNVFCQMYEKNPISKNQSDVELFHRRYGLSFWPLNERPQETALHVLASKFTSTQAMNVLKDSKFLEDFSDVPDSHGSTPLLLAIKCNNVEVVRRLLPAKPDINKRNRHNEYPIYVAALNDHADVLSEILETYSEPEQRTELLENLKNLNGQGHSILYPASQSGKPKVLNLVMEHDWWKDCLEQEKKSKEWELFVCNVCAAGCKNLAKKILEEDRSFLEKKEEGVVTPLMRAAEANQEEIVSLIFDIKMEHDRFDLCSLFVSCDEKGRNVFHYAVKNPKVLEYLLSQFVTLSEDYEDINKMDNFEDTPIKLAAVGKLTESFEMLLNYTSSKVDIFSAHLIHNVDIEVLKLALHNWKEEDAEAVECLLRGDHKEHQPFLEAAKKGNIELMEFFLEQLAEGPIHLQRTPNDQTTLHYAVLSGKLEAVEYLLKKDEFQEMIDYTDEVNITAAGYATQTGFSDILRCLLENNAQIKGDKKTARLNILDSAYGYFKTGENSIREIIKFCTKDKRITMLQELFEDSHFGADCIMSKLIEETPDVAMLIFGLCVSQDKFFTHRSYGETKVERRVTYSIFSFKRKSPEGGKSAVGKLEAIESMINSKRDNCLGHPLVVRFLNMKMNSSRVQKWFILNILLYATFLFTLTAYGAIQSQGLHDLKSPGMIALSVIILIICAFHLIKEIFQLVLTKTGYTNDFENYIEWVMYICAVIYVVPGGSTKADGQIAAGAIAVFLGWINFSLFLKRFSLFGIYIIMAKRVFLTVCKVLPLVVLVIAAFSLSLSLLKPLDQGFKNVPISLLTTFVMMTGELDYRDTFLAGGPLHVLQKILLVLFILIISIAIMNLLTGLAVDDTNEIMKRSKEEKRIYKATLVITLESSLQNFPLFSRLKKENKIEEAKIIVDYPDQDQKSTWLARQWKKVYDDDEVEERLKAMTTNEGEDYGEQLDELREEMKQTKDIVRENEIRLKNIEAMLAQIHAESVRSSNYDDE